MDTNMTLEKFLAISSGYPYAGIITTQSALALEPTTPLVAQLIQEHLPPPPDRRRLREAVKATLRHVAAEIQVS